nr:hypothetical protein [Cytophagales bacterium]
MTIDFMCILIEKIRIMRTNIEIDDKLIEETMKISGQKTINMVIGTFCIENDITLLHKDKDFIPLEIYLGLKGITY